MNPSDFRNLTWLDIQARLVGLRQSVFEGLIKHGPCTTRELAKAMELDILTVRPRVCELVHLGVVELAAEHREHRAHEGRYRALTLAEAEVKFKNRHVTAEQTLLRV